MSDDILDEFPLDPQSGKKSPRGKKKKPNRSGGSPVEEIDALTPGDSALEDLPADVETPPQQAEEPIPIEDEVVPLGGEFDALPSAPPPVEHSDWEKFLISLPKDLLRLCYDCGLTTKALLLAHSPKTLALPVGKFTVGQVATLRTAMKVFDWDLAGEGAALAALPDPVAEGDVVALAEIVEGPADFQLARHREVSEMPMCY